MAFWQPGAAAPGLTLDRGSGLDKDVAAPVIDRKRLAHLPIQRQRAALPIYSHKRELLYAVETFRVVIVVGETGSGKTTQLPQYLHEAGWTENGMAVCCTQPRRVAAVSVANRVAEEMGVPIGSTVGYAVRFGEKRSRDGSTKLVFCTEGLLLREMMLDPLLSRYSVVILDEAHERTLHTDLLFGLLRKIMQRRPTLRLIVSSATLDAERFREFFDDVHTKEAAVSTIISVQGRQHPVDVLYSMQPVADYLRGAVDTALTIHRHEPPGDILIFMPGGEEVDAVVRVLKSEAPRTVCPLPLYAALPQATQNAVFAPAPSGCRRVIVATAIAETSITFGGVRFVIDPCLARIPFYDTTTGVESLVTIPASKASAAQRAGRAGRISPGKCLRLITERDYESMLPLRGVPEVQRADLSWVVLQLKALGVSDVAHFDFLSPPSPAAMVRALELLYSLGALDDSCALTPCGEVMAELPLEPRLSRALLASRDRGCEDAMLSVAAMLSVQGPWMPMRSTRDARERLREAMKAQADPLGDHVTYLHLYRDWSSQSEGSRVSWCDETCIDSRAMVRAGEVRMQLARYLRRLDPSKAEPLERHGDEEKTELLKAFVTGFFSHAARLCPDGRYRTLRTGAALECHPTSVTVHRVRPAEYIMYNEVVRTSELYARDVSTIQPRWLSELAPHFYEVKGDRGGEGLKRRRELMEEEMSLRGGAVRA